MGSGQQARLRAVLAAACGLLCLALFAANALAAAKTPAPPVFGPGLEAAAQALARPFAMDAAVTPGVLLSGISIDSRRITFTLGGAAGQAQVHVLPPAAAGGRLGIEVPPAPGQLAQAQAALAAAVAHNDDGTWTRRLTSPPPTPARGTPPPTLDWQPPLVAAAWLLVLLACLMRAVRLLRAQPRGTRLQLAAVLALVLAAALLARERAPLTPLRPNGHAFIDFGVAMSLPETEPTHAAEVHHVGPSWIKAQRLVVRLTGRHHDGVGNAAILLGVLASLLTAAAVWGASQGMGPALLAGMLVALLPVAVRVGHSESPLVFAQALVPAALWLAGRDPRPLDRAGLWTAVLLLATGHPFGAALALATLCLALLLEMFPPQTDPPQPVLSLRALLPWIAVATAALVALLALASRNFADPGPGDAVARTLRLKESLWGSWSWGSPPALLLAVLTGLGWILCRRGRSRLLVALGLSGALAAVLLPDLILSNCDASRLRYEAPLAPLLAMLFAALPATMDAARRRHRLAPLAVHACIAAVVVALAWPQAGSQRLDQQGRSYQDLRTVLDSQRGALQLLTPPPLTLASYRMPIGAWSAQGPTIQSVTSAEFVAQCRQGAMPSPSTLVLQDARCLFVGPDRQPARICEAIEALADPHRVLAAHPGRLTPEAELFHFTGDRFPWRLSAARCPPP